MSVLEGINYSNKRRWTLFFFLWFYDFFIDERKWSKGFHMLVDFKNREGDLKYYLKGVPGHILK